MDIKIEKRDDIAILHCEGVLDADTVALFRKRGNELLEGGTIKFILDVSSLSFIDSMGLGAMISLLRRAREKKGDVKVCGINREIKEIFEITRLHRLFEIFKNVEEAIQKF